MNKEKCKTSRDVLASTETIDKGFLELNRKDDKARGELDIQQMQVEVWISNKLDMEYEYLEDRFQDIKDTVESGLKEKSFDEADLEKLISIVNISGSSHLRVLINEIEDRLKEGLMSNVRYQFYKRAHETADKTTLELMLSINKKKVQLKMGPGVEMERLSDALGELRTIWLPKAKEQALNNLKKPIL